VSGQDIAFVVVGSIASIAAIGLVTTKNVVHGALYLVVTLAMIGAVYLILAAPFIAWVQVLIYVGAIVVLLLFSLMLTKAPIGREALDNQQRGLAVLVAAGVLAGLVYLVQEAFPVSSSKIPLNETTAKAIGHSIFSGFVLPFEVVSILLLAALIGAIALARRDEP
jgi:NADH-quinone oxidoreductase subunit J